MANRRPLYPIVAAALLGLVLVTPASAKVPHFTVEVDPQAPVAGEPITVTVRFWDDPAHTQPATWEPHGSIDDMLAFVPADGESSDWVFVPLKPSGDDTLRGTVTLPSSGRWELIAWPNEQIGLPPGYPLPVVVDVVVSMDPAPLAAGAIGIASVVALLALVRRRARRLAGV